MKQIQELLHKQMSRKEFVQFFAMAVVAIFGFGNFVSFVRQNTQQQNKTTATTDQQRGKGFGSSKFGT